MHAACAHSLLVCPIWPQIIQLQSLNAQTLCVRMCREVVELETRLQQATTRVHLTWTRKRTGGMVGVEGVHRLPGEEEDVMEAEPSALVREHGNALGSGRQMIWLPASTDACC